MALGNAIKEGLPFLLILGSIIGLKLSYDVLPGPAYVLLLTVLAGLFMVFGRKTDASERSIKRAEGKAEKLIEELTQQADKEQAKASKKKAAAEARAASRAKAEAKKAAEAAAAQAEPPANKRARRRQRQQEEDEDEDEFLMRAASMEQTRRKNTSKK